MFPCPNEIRVFFFVPSRLVSYVYIYIRSSSPASPVEHLDALENFLVLLKLFAEANLPRFACFVRL